MIREQLDAHQRLFILHLSLIEGVGPATISHIVRSKPDNCSWQDMRDLTQTDWIALGLSQRTAATVSVGLAGYHSLEQELERINAHGIEWVTYCDDGYPALLKHIYQPPSVLYMRGALLDTHAKSVAIVGSRNADTYAQSVIDLFVPILVHKDWSIVSGGAVGADSMAHRASLQASGKTIAVLGSGLLRPYPYQNKTLFEQIVQSGGTLVSSFALNAEAKAAHFPARNRIISGLSTGCVVVQAARKSGASITAHYALEQGRTVFAVPGMIDNPLSEGCHLLLQEGAMLATHAHDILAGLGEHVFRTESTAQSLSRSAMENTSKHTAASSHVESSSNSNKSVDTIETRILRLCEYPLSLEDVAQQCGMTYMAAQELLSDLQLDGLIRQNIAGQWLSC